MDSVRTAESTEGFCFVDSTPQGPPPQSSHAGRSQACGSQEEHPIHSELVPWAAQAGPPSAFLNVSSRVQGESINKRWILNNTQEILGRLE